jgi:hypothetical protein
MRAYIHTYLLISALNAMDTVALAHALSLSLSMYIHIYAYIHTYLLISALNAMDTVALAHALSLSLYMYIHIYAYIHTYLLTLIATIYLKKWYPFPQIIVEIADYYTVSHTACSNLLSRQ